MRFENHTKEMTIEKFAEEVMDRIRSDESLEGAETVLKTVEKLNSSYLGLKVRAKGRAIAPSFNLELLYQAFMDGSEDMNGIIKEIKDGISNAPDFETEKIFDYNWAKSRLVLRVYDVEWNAEKLADMPYKEMDGLAITYGVLIGGGVGPSGLCPVNNSLLTAWGVDGSRVHEDAMSSAPKLMPPRINKMYDILSCVPDINADLLPPPEDDTDMTVLTNNGEFYGAGALFYPGIQDQIAGRVGGDYFVLPSSIHEVLIIPDHVFEARSFLEGMVREVNQECVTPEERLSDHVYHYDAANRVFEKAETFEDRATKEDDNERTVDGI